ncbi:MAG: 30S ribosomal protein S9 [Bacteroidia bacterium]|nr:30S ribosomal protein S9 [Bacteroidia bacterium]
MSVTNTSGRRKTAVARIFLKKGSGNITVNGRPFKEYFTTGSHQYFVLQPLKNTNTLNEYDIKVNVKGGGITGQAQAIRLAIAKALVKNNPDYRTSLRAEGLLTRDSRMVERKKYGQKKARRRFQFTKR